MLKKVINYNSNKKVPSYDASKVHYLNRNYLSNYIGFGNRILPRRFTKLKAKEYKRISDNIKIARELRLL